MVLVCHVISPGHVIKGSNVHVLEAHQGKSSCFHIWSPQTILQQRYTGFCLTRDLARPRDQSFVLLYDKELLKVYPHPTKFDGHRQWQWRYTGFSLIVILEDHMMKGSCNAVPREILKAVYRFGCPKNVPKKSSSTLKFLFYQTDNKLISLYEIYEQLNFLNT